jgi:hypothetical protein
VRSGSRVPGELLSALERFARQARGLRLAQRLAEVAVMAQRPGGEPGNRGGPDAALWDVDHATRGNLIAGVRDQPNVGEKVLDLATVVEAGAADDLVGDSGAHELFFEDPALGVGPVEDGDVAIGEVLGGPQPEDLIGDPGRFVVLVVGAIAQDRPSGVAFGE